MQVPVREAVSALALPPSKPPLLLPPLLPMAGHDEGADGAVPVVSCGFGMGGIASAVLRGGPPPCLQQPPARAAVNVCMPYGCARVAAAAPPPA